MRRVLFAFVLAAVVPGMAAAQQDVHVGFRGWGPRVGITSNPNQVHFGAHIDFGNFAEHVRFQPNVEVGLGDNETVAAFNAEAAYRFLSSWDRWSPYVGGGVGLNIVGSDNGVTHDSSTDLGASALGGIERGMSNGDRVFFEAKLGLVNSPDLKLAVGWTFYR